MRSQGATTTLKGENDSWKQYLHYDIKSQIEKSVDDQNGQQIGSKVIGRGCNTIDGTGVENKNGY